MYNGNCKYNKKCLVDHSFMFTNIQSELFQLGSVMAILNSHCERTDQNSNVCLMINWNNGNEES